MLLLLAGSPYFVRLGFHQTLPDSFIDHHLFQTVMWGQPVQISDRLMLLTPVQLGQNPEYYFPVHLHCSYASSSSEGSKWS